MTGLHTVDKLPVWCEGTTAMVGWNTMQRWTDRGCDVHVVSVRKYHCMVCSAVSTEVSVLILDRCYTSFSIIIIYHCMVCSAVCNWTGATQGFSTVNIYLIIGRGDSSVVRALDLGSKGCRIESWPEQWENFLLQGQLSVLGSISVSIPPQCYCCSR